MLDLLVALGFIGAVLILTVLLNVALRVNNRDRTSLSISVHVWRNRNALAGSVYFAALMVLLLGAAFWGTR